MTEKTHYRKAFKSPYLSSADIVGPTILTVSHVRLELDQTKKTKDCFNTAHFVEPELRRGEKLKPMILNVHNSRIMKDLSGSHFIDDWKNVPITVYVDSNVKHRGETVEGLRISPQAPVTVKPEAKPGTNAWSKAMGAYKRDGNFNTALKHVSISAENQKLIISELENA